MKKSNIIFIVIDTLRSDFSGKIQKKLNLDNFVTYNNTVAPASWTTPTHASIFTGLYPILHQAHETNINKHIKIKLSNNYNLLTTVLNDYKYRTTLLSANPYIRPEFGFRGFNNFYDVPFVPNFSLLNSDDKRKFNSITEGNKSTVDKLGKLVDKKEFNLIFKLGFKFLLDEPYKKFKSFLCGWPKDKGINQINRYIDDNIFIDRYPQFLFINLMEIHEPYYINDTISEDFAYNLKNNSIDLRKINIWKKKYRIEVDYVSEKLTELFSILKEKDMFEDSLIIVTSDHGQLLGEHNRLWHGLFLYNELINVPLWIKYPSNLTIELLNSSNKYISHVNFKKLILKFANNSLINDYDLYEDEVFSESYGLTTSKNVSILTEKERKKFEKYRVAVYKNGMKCIFNVTDWNFESITKDYDENSIITNKNDFFKNEIMKFLQRRDLLLKKSSR